MIALSMEAVEGRVLEGYGAIKLTQHKVSSTELVDFFFIHLLLFTGHQSIVVIRPTVSDSSGKAGKSEEER